MVFPIVAFCICCGPGKIARPTTNAECHYWENDAALGKIARPTKLHRSWSGDHIWSLAGHSTLSEPGAQPIGERMGSTKDDVGVTRAVQEGVTDDVLKL